MITSRPLLGTRQLFVYWKLHSSHLDLALDALQRAQHELTSALPGLQARRFVRTAAAEEATVMEVYALEASRSTAGLADTDIARLDRAAAEAVQPWLKGRRHVEIFDALDP